MKPHTITLIVSLGIFSTLCLVGHADEPPAEAKEKSSLDLVLIPAGPFQMGDGLNELRKIMAPHWVHVSDFHIAALTWTAVGESDKLWMLALQTASHHRLGQVGQVMGDQSKMEGRRRSSVQSFAT